MTPRDHNARRDEKAQEYWESLNRADVHGMRTPRDFKAGWDACAKEYESEIAKREARVQKLERALNKLSMMTYGELAYTAEFQDRLRQIVDEALASDEVN